MQRPLDIAIVGAGMTGIACAALLARDGHRVVVHERFETSRPIGSGLMLQPTGQAALTRLGLLDDVEALGARIDRLHGVTDGGATVFDLAYHDAILPVRFAQPRADPRPHLPSHEGRALPAPRDGSHAGRTEDGAVHAPHAEDARGRSRPIYVSSVKPIFSVT
jgi:glycine/D-amino acid oxidase-like deaminating enzyme